MKLTSTAFLNGEIIPIEYTCDGDDTNPLLTMIEVPPEAVSLALIVDDPDAPEGTFTHWLVWNIDPIIEEIEEGEIPTGAEVGLNSAGMRSYTGPCPPSGQHRYFFKLYALDRELDVSISAQREEIDKAMEPHIIARAELLGIYGRGEEGEFNSEEV